MVGGTGRTHVCWALSSSLEELYILQGCFLSFLLMVINIFLNINSCEMSETKSFSCLYMFFNSSLVFHMHAFSLHRHIGCENKLGDIKCLPYL